MVLVWAEYIMVCHKIVVHFSSQKHFVYILEFRTNAFIQIWQTSGKRKLVPYTSHIRNMNEMPIHQLLLNVVSDGMSISRINICICVHIHIYLHIHTTHCTKHSGIRG